MGSIRPIDEGELDRLEPLWLSLLDHHARIAPRLAGLAARTPEDSWRRRRAEYARWFKVAETFALVAELDDEFLGYAFVTVGRSLASWESSDRVAELKTLSVAQDARDQGIGSRLFSAVCERLRADGVEEIAVSSVETNLAATRFYERIGLSRAFVVLVGSTAGSDINAGG